MLGTLPSNMNKLGQGQYKQHHFLGRTFLFCVSVGESHKIMIDLIIHNLSFSFDSSSQIWVKFLCFRKLSNTFLGVSGGNTSGIFLFIQLLYFNFDLESLPWSLLWHKVLKCLKSLLFKAQIDNTLFFFNFMSFLTFSKS